MEHPAFLEKLAELLDERTRLGKGHAPIKYIHKESWYNRFADGLGQFFPEDDLATRQESGSYFTLIAHLIYVWTELDIQEQGESRLNALDAFFDTIERKLLEAEKVNAGKRILVETSRGVLMIGGRPLLTELPIHDERAALSSDRLYRRVALLSNVSLDYQREIIDGGAHKESIYKLNGSSPTIGLGSLSGQARTYFSPTGRLGDVGNMPRIGFKSDGLQPAQTYVEELRHCIDWAIAQQIHILCLPELSVCPNGREVLQARLRELSQGGKLRYLTIVIAGSYHVNQLNETPVWLVDAHGEITEFMYRKHEAFETQLDTRKPALPGQEAIRDYAEAQGLLNGPYYHIREDIGSDDLALLVNLPIGLVGVLICKDFLVPRYYAKYDALEPDYLFIVSMNDRAGEFVQVWQKDAKRHALSAGFYVNATQAVDQADETTEVAFWGLPTDREKLKERKSRVYFRRVRQPTSYHKQLPDDGLVRVLLPQSPLNYDTAALNLV